MRRRKLGWCLAGVVGCMLALPAEARVPANEDRARDLERQARRAYIGGNSAEAVERFQAAWEIHKNPWFMCERGGIEAEMGRARDAAQSLTACLRLLNAEDKKAIGPTIERMLKEMRARVGELIVKSNVPDAEVLIDGKAMGKLPTEDPIFVEPGSHRVEVSASGYASDMRVAVFHAGTSMILPSRLEPMRVEVAPPSPERAPVELKEVEKPSTLAPLPLPVEKKAVPVVKGPVSIPMEGKAAEPERAPVRAAVILSGLGLSVAGAAVGAAGLVAASTARQDAKALTEPGETGSNYCRGAANDPCVAVYNAMDKAINFTVVGIAGIAVSIVGGAFIGYEFVRSAPGKEAANARVTLMAAPGGGSLQIAGRF